MNKLISQQAKMWFHCFTDFVTQLGYLIEITFQTSYRVQTE